MEVKPGESKREQEKLSVDSEKSRKIRSSPEPTDHIYTYTHVMVSMRVRCVCRFGTFTSIQECLVAFSTVLPKLLPTTFPDH